MASINIYTMPGITLGGIPANIVAGNVVNATVNNDSANFSFVDEAGEFIYDSTKIAISVVSTTATTITFSITGLAVVSSTSIQWKSKNTWKGINSDIKTLEVKTSGADRNATVGFTVSKAYTPNSEGVCILAIDTFTIVSGWPIAMTSYLGNSRTVEIAFNDGHTQTTAANMATYLNSNYTFRLRNTSTGNAYTILAATAYNTSTQYGCVIVDGGYTGNTTIDACCTNDPILLLVNQTVTPKPPAGPYVFEVLSKSTGLVISNPITFTQP